MCGVGRAMGSAGAGPPWHGSEQPRNLCICGVGVHWLISPWVQSKSCFASENITIYFTGLLKDKVETCTPAVEKRK